MAEFHIGDKVCVVFQGKYIPFKVTKIQLASDGTAVYAGQDTVYYPEERLDYDITPEQKEWLINAELRLQALSQGVLDTHGFAAEVERMRLPPSLMKQLITRYQVMMSDNLT